MFPPKPIHPYYFHADLIWWDGPFNLYSNRMFIMDIHGNGKNV